MRGTEPVEHIRHEEKTNRSPPAFVSADDGHQMATIGYRSAPQVANLGGHPVQPPFKIPESIIY